jgi:predicted nuclease of predicted toxin-antitoxin system
LRTAGHDVSLVADWDQDPGDEEILRRAHEEQRVVVTADKDFGELAVLRDLPHSGILRIVGFSARQQGPVCADVLARYESELSRSALVTAAPGRVRIRDPEARGEN